MGRSIVVAVDGGEESIHALTWCLQNIVVVGTTADEASSDSGGGVTGDTVVLLYARPSPSVYPAMDGSGYLFSSDIIASMDNYAKHLADTVTQKAKMVCSSYPNLKVEIKVQNGDPRDVICEMVEKLGADMLVMGSHGYGPLKRAFIGSVSSYCAQNVKCPVLIVKKPKN
ncbi:universal stress protein PHOS32 [Dendrobium catenatum]|uniref:UspA domain-containing protein n=2 Tax=Dendrobium TaxID=37818 RepID=A0A8T3ABH1_DENNO|nr:universal stress protein PHOS32 [Dendrobium catenatum]KAI0493433.1 hypothetical protein KFK09_023549 [Dendrobium nobile]PKU60893.1 Universal stress protein A-like protein [Dendrobium catenatum]